MAWFLLTIAGLLEVVWAIAMKFAHGFTRPVPTIVFAVTMLASVFLLGRAARDLPIGTAYAVWTGIGAAGTAVVGMIVFGESHDWKRIVCLLLVLAGIGGLKVLSPS